MRDVEKQAQHHGGRHTKQNMNQCETTFALAFMLRRAAKVNANQAEQTAPEHHHHGENGAQLNNHFEGFCRFALKAQQVTHDNHVSGTGNRQKLRQSFDHTQYCRYQQRVHIAHQINP